jgi:superfamily II DNA/RNA helicase
MNFNSLPLAPDILQALDDMRFQYTTPIQELTIPIILQHQDLIACAQTGTGKTAAYVLPIINQLHTKPHPLDAVNAVILAPTRELAQQIDRQIQGFAYFIPISAVAIYGGTDGHAWDTQRRGLELGADIVVATPGRLISHIKMDYVKLNRTAFFVLDEADRMLDMGFLDDILTIFKLLPKSCQILMFSATMPPKIRTLAHSILKNPAEITIEVSKPPESIIQSAYICFPHQKLPILKHILQHSPKRVIVFSSSKLKVKDITHHLQRLHLNVAAMHSDLDQSSRDSVMKNFKSGATDILVATDVVARGIDIADIALVINFDIPRDPEDYVHRIGRTARGTNNASGSAITLVDPNEQFPFSRIEAFLGKPIPQAPVPPAFGDTPPYDPTPKPHMRPITSSASRSRKPSRRNVS